MDSAHASFIAQLASRVTFISKFYTLFQFYTSPNIESTVGHLNNAAKNGLLGILNSMSPNANFIAKQALDGKDMVVSCSTADTGQESLHVLMRWHSPRKI